MNEPASLVGINGAFNPLTLDAILRLEIWMSVMARTTRLWVREKPIDGAHETAELFLFAPGQLAVEHRVNEPRFIICGDGARISEGRFRSAPGYRRVFTGGEGAAYSLNSTNDGLILVGAWGKISFAFSDKVPSDF